MLLSSGRNVGMGGPLPISLQEILAYCSIYAIEEKDELEDFVLTIRTLDAEWLAESYKRQKSKKK